MKKILIASISILYCFLGLSQSKIVIVDGNTKEPLPFTTIQAINTKEGFITDQNGIVLLNLAKTDTLHISYVGYTSINYIIGKRTSNVPAPPPTTQRQNPSLEH